MGKQAEHIYKSFTLEKKDEEDYETILERFDAYFVPKRNVESPVLSTQTVCRRIRRSVHP